MVGASLMFSSQRARVARRLALFCFPGLTELFSPGPGVWSSPDSNVFSRARVCLRPPQKALTTRAPASLPAPPPTWARPRVCITAGRGAGWRAAGRDIRPWSQAAPGSRPPTNPPAPEISSLQLQSPPQQSRDRRSLPGSPCFLAL